MLSNSIPKKHNYLLIATYFPPFQDSGTYRTVRFVKYLVRYGWWPSVVVPRNLPLHDKDVSLLEDIPSEARVYNVNFLYPSWQGLLAILQPEYAARRLSAIKQRGEAKDDSQIPNKTNIKGKSLGRPFAHLLLPDNYVLFVLPAFIKGLQIIRRENIEVIYTSGSPHSNHLVGYFLKQLTGLPWVADFRDFWVDLDSLSGHWRWQKKLNYLLERQVIEKADHIIGYSTGITQRLANKLEKGDPHKFTSITAGVDKEKYDRVLPFKFEGFVLAHVGRFNKLFPRQIFEAASIFYKRNPNFRFVLAGPIDPEVYSSIDRYKEDKKDVDIKAVTELFPTFSKLYPSHPYTPKIAEMLNAIHNLKVGDHFLDFSAPTIDGDVKKVSELIKGKVAVIDMWASWCGPCRYLSKSMIPVYEKYKDKGFTIVGVAAEFKTKEPFKAAIKKTNTPGQT